MTKTEPPSLIDEMAYLEKHRLDWCSDKDCGMRKYHHRLMDCHIKLLEKNARELNYGL